MKALRKNLSKLKGVVGQLELKQSKLDALDRSYVADKTVTDVTDTSTKLDKAKQFLLQKIAIIDNLTPDAVDTKIEAECQSRTDEAVKIYETMKTKLQTIGI